MTAVVAPLTLPVLGANICDMTQQSSEQLEHQSLLPEVIATVGALMAIGALGLGASNTSNEAYAAYDAVSVDRSHVVNLQAEESNYRTTNPKHAAIQGAVDVQIAKYQGDQKELKTQVIGLGVNILGLAGVSLLATTNNRSIRRKLKNNALLNK